MDVVDFFKQQVDAYNESERCGSCYEFSAPMDDAALNTVQSDEPCCVQIMLTDLSQHTVRNYNTQTGLEISKVTDYNFVLRVLKQSRIDINTYNEIKGHPVAESKWETIYKPLMECFGQDAVLAFCDILGYVVDIPKWSMVIDKNVQDENYDGWKITATFREKSFN